MDGWCPTPESATLRASFATIAVIERHMSQESLLTTVEVAALLKVHPKQVYRLMKQGLPAHRMGGEWRFSKGEVLAWAEGREKPASVPAPQRELPVFAPPLLAANGDVAVELLLSSLEERASLLVGFVLSDKGQATNFLQQNRVLLAGCHGEQIPARLDGERLARVHLVEREVVLASLSARPIKSIKELERRSLASRPETAGVYHHLMSATRGAGLDGAKVQQRAKIYGSHREVACAVARGEAELGVVTRAWASRLGLACLPIATESYGLLVKARDLGDPRVVKVCEVAQSAPLQQKMREVPGYNPTNAGDIRYDAE